MWPRYWQSGVSSAPTVGLAAPTCVSAAGRITGLRQVCGGPLAASAHPVGPSWPPNTIKEHRPFRGPPGSANLDQGPAPLRLGAWLLLPSRPQKCVQSLGRLRPCLWGHRVARLWETKTPAPARSAHLGGPTCGPADGEAGPNPPNALSRSVSPTCCLLAGPAWWASCRGPGPLWACHLPSGRSSGGGFRGAISTWASVPGTVWTEPWGGVSPCPYLTGVVQEEDGAVPGRGGPKADVREPGTTLFHSPAVLRTVGLASPGFSWKVKDRTSLKQHKAKMGKNLSHGP